MQIIAISGKAQHGKDTTANYMRDALEADGYRVLVAHYADLLKFICKQYFGWDGQKDEKGRRILQYVGTDVVRTKKPNYWVNFIKSLLELFPEQWDYVIIPDCRFPNEIDELRNAGFQTIHMRVKRTNFESQLTPEQQSHPSETALDDRTPDYYIYNCSTLDDLQEAIFDWVCMINGQHQMTIWELEAQT